MRKGNHISHSRYLGTTDGLMHFQHDDPDFGFAVPADVEDVEAAVREREQEKLKLFGGKNE